jgi:hypothetical protein
MQNLSHIHMHSHSLQVSTSGEFKLQPHIVGGKLCRAPKLRWRWSSINLQTQRQIANFVVSGVTNEGCQEGGEWHPLAWVACSQEHKIITIHLLDDYKPYLGGWDTVRKCIFECLIPLWVICRPILSVTKMWTFTTFKNLASKDFEQVFKQEPRLPS